MARTAYLVTRGAVLRETETKETDSILTVLTPELGKIPVIARGARRKHSRFAAVCQTLTYSEMTLYQKGDWYYLNEGTTLDLFVGLRKDFEALALGCYFAELTEAVTAPGEEAGAILSHLLNGLYVLNQLKKPPPLVKAAFELKLLCLAGYEPLADGCAVCGAKEPENARLDVVQGVLRCASCGDKGNGLSLPLNSEAVAALRRILYGDAKRLYSFVLTGTGLRQLGDAAESYAAAQLERGFRTLDYYKTLSNA